MARQPASAEGSMNNNHGSSSRRTSQSSLSNPNVFSDDYALNRVESFGDTSSINSIPASQERLTLGERHNTTFPPPTSIPVSHLPDHISGSSRPLSTSKRPIPSDAGAQHTIAGSSIFPSDASTVRTFSTSSRFSIPRSQSPYNGPTAPSQPYAMYSQMNRTPSMASESTLRPSERPFVPQGGPEHPYAMYTQNTVPEEDDDDDDSIPASFHPLPSSYRGGSSTSGNDVGDIVGTDGHVEQLPPYTRYADNVIAKGDMARVEPPVAVIEGPSTPPDMVPGAAGQTIEMTTRGSAGNEDTEDTEHANVVARKEGWVDRHKKRRCLGLPFFTVVLIITTIVLAAVLGGVIGGVVGNQRGAERAYGSSVSTTTMYLDADPVETNTATPTCPTGHYNVPLNQTQEINTCIINTEYDLAWGCMDQAALGISLFDQGQDSPLQIVFDDYSLQPKLFRYGPQPPDLNGTTFDLKPVKDKDDDELGVAMFFSVLFDKLIILPGDVFTPPSQKRSTRNEPLSRRGVPWTNQYLSIGDEPWYCYWNMTVNEFWIFLQQDMQEPPPPSSSSVPVTSVPTSTPTYSSPSSVSGSAAASSVPSAASAAASAAASGQFFTSIFGPMPTSWPTGKRHRRQYSNVSGSPEFPKLVKMVEKRKPHSNQQPYCQKMHVGDDWVVVPKLDVPLICLDEQEFQGTKRDAEITQMMSTCICEWFSYNL